MSGVRPEKIGLRHQSKRSGGGVSPLVELPSGFPLLPSPGQLSLGWNLGRMGSLGGRERANDALLQDLSGPMGPTPVLERGCGRLRDQLGMRFSGRQNSRRLWLGTPLSRGRDPDWNRRDCRFQRAQVPHHGLSARCRLPEASLVRAGTKDQDPSPILSHVRKRTFLQSPVRLQRHVASLPESHREESSAGPEHSRQVPHHEEVQRGHRSGSALGDDKFKASGQENLLANGRWAVLKRPENLTEKQTVRLSELL